MNELSIVTCTVDERRYEKFARSIAKHFAAIPIKLIKVSNPPSLAAGYNMGLKAVNTPLVLFCHDDIEILSPHFAVRLLSHMRKWDIVGVAGAARLRTGLWIAAGQSHVHGQIVQNHGNNRPTLDIFDPDYPSEDVAQAMVLDGVFIAARTGVAQEIGFDESIFRSFHFYDLDFTLRCSLAGCRVGIARDLLLYHDSPGRFDAVWYYYCGRFEQKYLEHLHQDQTEEAKIFKQELAPNDSAVKLFQSVRKITW